LRKFYWKDMFTKNDPEKYFIDIQDYAVHKSPYKKTSERNYIPNIARFANSGTSNHKIPDNSKSPNRPEGA
jgi:hypothetical protein